MAPDCIKRRAIVLPRPSVASRCGRDVNRNSPKEDDVAAERLLSTTRVEDTVNTRPAARQVCHEAGKDPFTRSLITPSRRFTEVETSQKKSLGTSLAQYSDADVQKVERSAKLEAGDPEITFPFLHQLRRCGVWGVSNIKSDLPCMIEPARSNVDVVRICR
jgi:hypothetical protein